MKAITTNSFYAWILAARPKTLTGAVIPVLIGSSLAFADGKFDIIPALLCVLFACGMQIAANFINDLYDYLKGSDRADRLGPERACAQGWITPIAMKRGIAGTLIFSCLMGCALLQQCWGRLPHGGWELILLGLLCVIFAFLYPDAEDLDIRMEYSSGRGEVKLRVDRHEEKNSNPKTEKNNRLLHPL